MFSGSTGDLYCGGSDSHRYSTLCARAVCESVGMYPVEAAPFSAACSYSGLGTQVITSQEERPSAPPLSGRMEFTKATLRV